MPPRDKHGVLSNKFPRDRGYVGSRVVASGPLCKRRRAKSWQSDIVAAFCCDDNGKLYVLYLDSSQHQQDSACIAWSLTSQEAIARPDQNRRTWGGGGLFSRGGARVRWTLGVHLTR